MDAPTVASGLEPGSFRDPDSRVFTTDGRVLRLLSEQGLADWRELSSTGLVDELVGEGRLVGTREVEEEAALGEAIHGGVAGVLEHDRIPFVSYPYEWTFSMLRDAALLQLGLLRRALDQGLILKDSTPYNVQFWGTEPVFIDVGSFEKQREGEPWAGYRQFCMLFLNPLLLQAYKGIDFRPWLRGSLAGITPAETRHLLASQLAAYAAEHGFRFVGSTWSGDVDMESFTYQSPAVAGWLSIVSLKPRRPGLDHFLVSVQELDRQAARQR